jgi:hypothetical protein
MRDGSGHFRKGESGNLAGRLGNSARRAAALLPEREAAAMTSMAAAAQGAITPDEALTLSQLVAASRCPRVEAQAPRRMAQYRALPGVRGKGIASRTLARPVM